MTIREWIDNQTPSPIKVNKDGSKMTVRDWINSTKQFRKERHKMRLEYIYQLPNEEKNRSQIVYASNESEAEEKLGYQNPDALTYVKEVKIR